MQTIFFPTMVSWGYAFDKGLSVFLLAIGWQLLGFLIAALISAGALFAILRNPTDIATVFAQSFFAVIVGILIGSIIAQVGTYATIIKVAVESAEELRFEGEEDEEPETKPNSSKPQVFPGN